jgi:hypothetical protein
VHVAVAGVTPTRRILYTHPFGEIGCCSSFCGVLRRHSSISVVPIRQGHAPSSWLAPPFPEGLPRSLRFTRQGQSQIWLSQYITDTVASLISVIVGSDSKLQIFDILVRWRSDSCTPSANSEDTYHRRIDSEPSAGCY